MKVNEHVDMILHSTDANELAVEKPDLMPDETVKFFMQIEREGVFAFLRTEYNVVQCCDFAHGKVILRASYDNSETYARMELLFLEASPFQGSFSVSSALPGVNAGVPNYWRLSEAPFTSFIEVYVNNTSPRTIDTSPGRPFLFYRCLRQ